MSKHSSEQGRSRLRIVTGKGGVGKTTVATALALAEARCGRRTLLLEVNGRSSVAQLLEAPPVGSELREVLENLFVVDMNPRDAIREYVLLMFRFESIYKAVFENRFVKHFLRLVPSLAELVMLGKLWYHEQEREGSRPRFDTLILDAPATGHALAMLRAPEVVQTTVPPGPLRDNARLIHALLTDVERTCLHVVTTPEEMPVNEAVELERAAADSLQMRLGACVINQRLDALDPRILAQLAARRDDPELAPLYEALSRRETKREMGEANLQRLPSHMLSGALSLPRIAASSFGRAAVETLATSLLPLVGGEERS